MLLSLPRLFSPTGPQDRKTKLHKHRRDLGQFFGGQWDTKKAAATTAAPLAAKPPSGGVAQVATMRDVYLEALRGTQTEAGAGGLLDGMVPSPKRRAEEAAGPAPVPAAQQASPRPALVPLATPFSPPRAPGTPTVSAMQLTASHLGLVAKYFSDDEIVLEGLAADGGDGGNSDSRRLSPPRSPRPSSLRSSPIRSPPSRPPVEHSPSVPPLSPVPPRIFGSPGAASISGARGGGVDDLLDWVAGLDADFGEFDDI